MSRNPYIEIELNNEFNQENITLIINSIKNCGFTIKITSSSHNGYDLIITKLIYRFHFNISQKYNTGFFIYLFDYKYTLITSYENGIFTEDTIKAIELMLEFSKNLCIKNFTCENNYDLNIYDPRKGEIYVYPIIHDSKKWIEGLLRKKIKFINTQNYTINNVEDILNVMRTESIMLSLNDTKMKIKDDRNTVDCRFVMYPLDLTENLNLSVSIKIITVLFDRYPLDGLYTNF
jgi:hypothetical protein